MEQDTGSAPEGATVTAVKDPELEGSIPEPRRKLVTSWLDKIKQAEKHWNDKKIFDKMRQCQKLARNGTSDDTWLAAGKYVVPIIVRHINQAVGQLYAKNPTTVAKRRPRLLYQVWDGKKSTLDAAMEGFATGDPSFAPLLQDIVAGQDYMRMADRVAKTLEICWQYFMDEQEYDYKTQLKALVRRTKTNAVGYLELDFQRQTGATAEVEGKIADCRKKIAETERLLAEMQEPDADPTKKELAQLELNLADLQKEQRKIYREGPVLTFPASSTVVPDPACKHLKSFLGAKWIAKYLDLTPEEGVTTFGVDVKKSYSKRTEKVGDKDQTCDKARFWRVQDKVNRQFFVVCEGYPDFVVEPAEPLVKIDRFYTIFALVFNECEDEQNPFPESDAWHCKHIQDEYNRSREGLRQHRKANAPYYTAPKGVIDDTDKGKLADHMAHELIELNLSPEQVGNIEKIVARGPNIAIDPNQYEVGGLFDDMMRTVGVQEANIGPTSGATATESSIAENSRMSSQSDNVDDLDDFLSQVARAGGQLMLAELSKETVMEIAGPGAVWPDFSASKEEIQKDLMLEIKAGSSGRPNRAADLADMERAFPAIQLIPGFNPEPLAERYLTLLNIDPEEGYVEGLPSLTALNAMAGKQVQPGTGDPATDPNAQGAQGGDNAAQPPANEPGAQPAYPAPGQGTAPMANA